MAKWYVLSCAKPGIRLGIYTDWNELGRILKGHRPGEAIYQKYDTEEEANRIWDRERAILERERVARDAPRDHEGERRSGTSAAVRQWVDNATASEVQFPRRSTRRDVSPPSPTISSQSTLTSQRDHRNRVDHRQQRISDSEDEDSSLGPVAPPQQRVSRVSVDTSYSSSASNRATRPRDRPIPIPRQKEQNASKQARKAMSHTGTLTDADNTNHTALRATVDTSYSYSGSSADYKTCETSNWTEERSDKSIGPFSRVAPRPRRCEGREVPTSQESLSKSSAGRVGPSNVLKRAPTNRVISIPTDDSEDEGAPQTTPRPSTRIRRQISKACCETCGQSLPAESSTRVQSSGDEFSRHDSVASVNPTKAVKAKATKLKVSGSAMAEPHPERQGPALRGSQVASGSRGPSSKTPSIQRSSTLPVVSSSSHPVNAVSRALTSPATFRDAFSGPAQSNRVVRDTAADPRSPIVRGGAPVPVEYGRVVQFGRPSPLYPNLLGLDV